MTRVLVTGMSGTGKTTLLDGLARRGHRTVDTDYDGWTGADGLWDEPRITTLLNGTGDLVVSGTPENLSRFTRRFDHVVLLSAPLETLISRVTSRATNPYGSRPQDLVDIARHQRDVEPRLRRIATVELDGRSAPEALVDAVEELLTGGRGH